MVQPFPTGLDSFCAVWRVFVLLQFRTRYSGHTLSRLAEIKHNKTKQSRFPNTRRESPKSWVTLNTIQVSSSLSRASKLHLNEWVEIVLGGLLKV